jgi:GTPase SAR1 family protein
MNFMNYLKNANLPKARKITTSYRAEPLDPIKILLAGEINAGKSSLINALLGEKLLPEAIARHTAAVHYCRFGKEKLFRVFFRDHSHAPESHPLTGESLTAYLDEAGKAVDFIEVEHPAIPEGLDLIDTPGINDEDPYRDTLVRSFMSQADALIFVFDANRSVTRTEVEFLSGYLGKFRLNHCIFVANKSDQIPVEKRGENQAVFLKTLREYVSPKIHERQAIMLSTRFQNGETGSVADLMPQLSELLQKHGKITQDRQTRKRLDELTSQLNVSESKLSLVGGRNSEACAVSWRFRASRLLKSSLLLRDSKQRFFEDIRSYLDQELERLSGQLAHAIEIYGVKENFLPHAESELSTVLEGVKQRAEKLLARKLELTITSSALDSALGNHVGRTTEARMAQQKSDAEAGLASNLSGVGASFLFFSHPMVAMGLAAWGVFHAHGQREMAAKQEHDLKQATHDEIRTRLQSVSEKVMESLEAWYEEQIQTNECAVTDFLKQIYAAFDPSSIQDVAALEKQVAQLRADINATAVQLGNGAAERAA